VARSVDHWTRTSLSSSQWLLLGIEATSLLDACETEISATHANVESSGLVNVLMTSRLCEPQQLLSSSACSVVSERHSVASISASEADSDLFCRVYHSLALVAGKLGMRPLGSMLPPAQR
jgi:hypothetical protein